MYLNSNGFFAFLRISQRLNRSLSAITSVVHKYQDPFVKADRCAQYVDYIRIAAHTPDELIINLEHVFEQLDKAGLKVNMGICEFGQKDKNKSRTQAKPFRALE